MQHEGGARAKGAEAASEVSLRAAKNGYAHPFW